MGVRLFFCLAFGLASISSAFAAVSELSGLRNLAQAGAPQLALLRIDALQPAMAEDLRGWIRWERARLELLAESGHWRALAERAALQPEGVPRGFSRWLRAQRAEALLQLGKASEARAELRRLIWSAEGDAEALATWRRQLIRAYLLEGRGEDAYTALLRYQGDYGEGEAAESLLAARVLLAQGHYREALSRLEALDSGPERDALIRLARLRSGDKGLVKPMRAAAEAAAKAGSAVDRRLHGLLWASLAEATGGEPGQRIIALEQLFSRRDALQGQRDLFSITIDNLWQAYFDYAERAGNRRQLLLGDDAAWLALAAEDSRRYPVRSHSLYALMASNASSAEARDSAHAQLAQLLAGSGLLRPLYLDSQRFGQAERLPAVIRQALVDGVIAEGDLVLAARLLTGLEQAPATVDAFLWQLRRAKVFILAAEYRRAEAVLAELIGSPGLAEEGRRDRLVQLLFDLQSVGRHDLAYKLLQAMLLRSSEPQLQRELLFWMADSRKAQSRLREAARLYLESATLPGVHAMDPWAQTARYQAAQVLADAELFEDAAGLYRGLLAVTEDPARRVVLRRELEQLQLRERR